MAQTWLRIVTYQVAAGDTKAREYLTDSLQEVIRSLSDAPGFRGGHWGHDTDTTTFAAVTNWATRESIEAADKYLSGLHQQRKAKGLQVGRAVNLRLVTTPTEWSAADWQVITSREASNWLRVFFYHPDAADDPSTVDYLRSSTTEAIATLRQQKGFRVGYWGHDPVDGTMAAVTYWDDRRSIDNAGPELDRLHEARKEHGIGADGLVNLELLRTDVQPGHAARGWLSEG